MAQSGRGGGAGEPGAQGEPSRLLLVERARTVDQIEALSRDFDSIVESCEADAYDDEHDPEGHTIAYERQQVAALLREARSHLASLDLALERLVSGTYGTCAGCGHQIAAARLASRPAASTCVGCAASGGEVLRRHL